ncbi:MAG: ABC transporter ATP-binding protein/permease [Alphaproteobacteria bacterium]|nr:ABC transporter ATP-binding protein/permease [Alphaproteobacteria bacterium]
MAHYKSSPRRAADYQASEGSENHWQTIKTLLPYIWIKDRLDLKIRVILALLSLVAAKLIGIYVPFLFKDAVDILSPGLEPNAKTVILTLPLALILGYGLARILSIFFGQLRDAIFARVGQNALRKIALSTFCHLHNLSLRFHMERKTGGLSRVIERGTKGIDFLLRFMLFNILPTLFEIILITVVFWTKFGFYYALVTAICLTGYIFYTIKVTDWRLKFRREMNRQDTEANTRAIDSLLNFETVKYFTNEDHEARRYDSTLAKYEQASVRSQTSLALLNVGQHIIISLGLVIVLLMAAQGVIDRRFTIGEFVLVNSLLIQIYMPLNFLGMVYREIRQSLVDMENMFAIIRRRPDSANEQDFPELIIKGGEVTFSNVSFHYIDNRPILKNISFKVAAGTTTAIVGSSGAGKSTISRILFRFYDISAGKILIDGQDIAHVSQKSLRRQIGIVPQDTVLFNDTIRYNIRYGRPDASDDELEEAARHAQIHKFVRALPDQYDSEVGERGLKLSGGEKQRVAIARTILKDPAILVLDEATSALDSHTEMDIQQALEDISRNRTTIVIAHRLSTIVNANEIIVLEAGEIVERGRHDALLDRRGAYYNMWQKQKEATEVMRKLAALDEFNAEFDKKV